jgi:RNA polymerase sigma factor (sigma-70 family)
MPTSQTSGVIQHLRRTMLLRDGAGLTDGQLLEDYISRRDEAALAALVQRHGPMVWGVCRRVLRSYHDAEDAFQATFLVFVRKAAAIAARELVGNWLYGVAHQTALKARATAARRKERERQVTQMPEPAVAEPGQWHDLQPLLDAELSRLPDKYRAVIVLCDLEGKTRKEVAHQLGCPEGTVAGRLSRARVMLAKQLARRGVVLSGGALAAVLSRNVASAAVPPLVVSSTIKAASLSAAGKAAATGAISVKVAALTEGVLQAMLLTKLKIATAVLFLIAVLGVAAWAGGSTGATATPPDVKQANDRTIPPSRTHANEKQPEQAKKEPKVLTPEEAIKQGSKEEVTVQFRVKAVEAKLNPYYGYSGYGFGGPSCYISLKDGGKFIARLGRAADQFMAQAIDPVKHFNGKVVRVTGRIQPDSGNAAFMMWVVDLAHLEVVNESLEVAKE